MADLPGTRKPPTGQGRWCYHEAGHTAMVLFTGLRFDPDLDYATVEPREGLSIPGTVTGGHVQYRVDDTYIPEIVTKGGDLTLDPSPEELQHFRSVAATLRGCRYHQRYAQILHAGLVAEVRRLHLTGVIGDEAAFLQQFTILLMPKLAAMQLTKGMVSDEELMLSGIFGAEADYFKELAEGVIDDYRILLKLSAMRTDDSGERQRFFHATLDATLALFRLPHRWTKVALLASLLEKHKTLYGRDIYAAIPSA